MSLFRCEIGSLAKTLPPRPPKPPQPPVLAGFAGEPHPRRPRPSRRAELAARLLRLHSLLSAFLSLLLGLGGLAACANPVENEKETEAILMLSFGSTARAFAPLEAVVSLYSVVASTPEGLRSESLSSEAALTLRLAAGTWLISVEGLSENGLRIVSGSLSLSLSPGERRSATIVLLPDGGAGTVSLGWSTTGAPPGLPSIQGSLRRNERSIPLTAPGFAGSLAVADLEAGVWTLELALLADGVKLAGLADSVLVVAGCDTRVELSFEPPTALLSLALVSPSFVAEALEIRPPLRRVALGTQAVFLKPLSDTEGSWYRNGDGLGGGSLLCLSGISEEESRIDWVSGDPWRAQSGRARLIRSPPSLLGPLSWEESLFRAEMGGAPAWKGLDGCRGLAFGATGESLLAVGKDGNTLSDLALYEGGGPVPRAGVSLAEGMGGPEYIAEIGESGSFLVLSPASSLLLTLGRNAEGDLAILGELRAEAFASAKALQVEPGGARAWLVSEGSDALLSVSLSGEGLPLEAKVAADPASPGFEGLDRPTALCLSKDGGLLAFGSSGDDSLWICELCEDGGIPRLLRKFTKLELAALASLSDPVDCAFSPDGAALFVLSYYGRSLIRLDRDGAGVWTASAAAKSGVLPVIGFDYPKHLAISPEGRLLVVSGGGAADGLAAFDVGAGASIAWLGALLPAGEAGHPNKPGALAFSPDGLRLAVACPEEDSLHLFRRSLP